MLYANTVKNSSNIVSLSFSFFPVYATAFLIMLPLMIVRSVDAAEWTGKGEDPTKFEDPKNWDTMRVPDQDEEVIIRNTSKIFVSESRTVKQLKLDNATIEMNGDGVFLNWLQPAVLIKSHLEVNGMIKGASLKNGSSLFGPSIDISDVVFQDSTIRAESVILGSGTRFMGETSLFASKKVEIKDLIGSFDNKESVISSPLVEVINNAKQNITFTGKIIPLDGQDTVKLQHRSGNKLELSVDNQSPALDVVNTGKEIKLNRTINSLDNKDGKVTGNAKIIRDLNDKAGNINPGESPGWISADNIILDSTNIVFEILGLVESSEYDQIFSNALLYGNSSLYFDMQDGPSLYPTGSEFYLFDSGSYTGSPSSVYLNAQGTAYEGLSFSKFSADLFKTDVTPHDQFLLYKASTGTLYVQEVPAPLPIMGLGIFASYARKLRKLSSRSRSIKRHADSV